MQFKWLEDLAASAQTRSFSCAVELRSVTHPAFGRRIKALEAWTGTPLTKRGSSPVTFTSAGVSLLDNAQQMLRSMGHARGELRILTRSLLETAQLLERGDADFMLTYHHPLLALQLSARQYMHLSLGQDRLVAVSHANAHGQGLYSFERGVEVPSFSLCRNADSGPPGRGSFGQQPTCARL